MAQSPPLMLAGGRSHNVRYLHQQRGGGDLGTCEEVTAVLELRTCEGDRCRSRAHRISKVTPVDR
jgi:hypothetical protein